MTEALVSLRARAERELEYAEWAGTLRASEMDGIGAEHLSTRLLAACYREKALLDRLEAAERAIDEASQLQHRAEMGWADTQAALEAAEHRAEDLLAELGENDRLIEQAWRQRDDETERAKIAEAALEDLEQKCSEFSAKLKTAERDYDEATQGLATELAEERTLHQEAWARLLAAQQALWRIAEGETECWQEQKIARAALAAIPLESTSEKSVGRVPAQEPQ